MPELIALCSKLGLPDNGNKNVLIQRILSHQKGEPVKEEPKEEKKETKKETKKEPKKEEKETKKEETKSSGGGSGGRSLRPDSMISGRDNYSVYQDFAVKLNQTNINANNNKYYILQMLTKGSTFYVWTRWGRVGEPGQNKV